MKKILIPGILILFFALTTVLQAGSPTFTGEWDTFWGDRAIRMTLIQKGNKVSGVYAYKGGNLSGVIEDGVLKGTWLQKENGKRGTFRFTLLNDGVRFHGKWRYDSKGEWLGDWTGARR